MKDRLEPEFEEDEDGPEFEKIDGIEILCGDALRHAMKNAAALPRRDCFAGLKRYVSGQACRGRVLLLNGLRRTGKTVMAMQAAAELPPEEFSRTAFIRAAQGIAIPCLPVYDLMRDLFRRGGIANFFVDECTALTDFPAWSKMIADGIAAEGGRAVLLGTDSLSMRLAEREFLEGRYAEIRTTRIPFHEWKRLLEGRCGRGLSAGDYVRYGGILDFDGVPAAAAVLPEPRHSFRDPESIAGYVHSAIALNIQNSLARDRNGAGFKSLRLLWESGQLSEAIARIVQNKNHEIVLKHLHLPFISEDYINARNVAMGLDPNLRKPFKKLNKDIKKKIRARLCISEDDLPIQITRKESSEILKYLMKIDVFRKAEVRIMPSVKPEKRRGLPLWTEESRMLQTQPGIRAGQMRLACEIVWNAACLFGAPIERDEFFRKAEAEVQGQMLEDIVFSELQDILPEGCRIFKLEWDADPGETAEFDAAVADWRDPGNPKVSLFEVKHADSDRGGPERHVKNPLAIAQAAEAFGRVVSRTVVYGGQTERRAVLWVNADEFLEAAGQDPEACLFPQLSERWSPLCSSEPWLAAAADPGVPAECAPEPEAGTEPEGGAEEEGESCGPQDFRRRWILRSRNRLPSPEELRGRAGATFPASAAEAPWPDAPPEACPEPARARP